MSVFITHGMSNTSGSNILIDHIDKLNTSIVSCEFVNVILDSGILKYGLDRACSGQVQVVGTCQCGNEHSGFIKCGEILD